eukprot:1171362-Pleurochrysis_carterae.AAC.2
MGTMSEDSGDSQGRTRDESDTLEHACTARHAIYEKQVKDLGEILDPTSSEGEEEGEEAERRRTRRKQREEEMRKRRTQKEKLYREYMESRRCIIVEERVIRNIRSRLEEQLEQKQQARLIGKKLRAKRRVIVRKEEQRAREARQKRRSQ